MRLLGIEVGEASPARLDSWRHSAPTYAPVASTLGTAGEGRTRVAHVTAALGHGQVHFDAAVAALRSWAPQRSLAARVHPTGVHPTLGATVVLAVGVGPLRLLVPNRVVAIVDEPDRWGYAYGSLPGHPVTGEELFVVERRSDGSVHATVVVDARPAPPLRWLGPVVPALERRAVRRYLRVLQQAVRRSSAR
jgi:uncharacterized protein (UPF0548 family)